MDKQQAKHIIQETFENSFVKERFAGFIKNLLKRIEEDRIPQRQGQFVPEAYRQYINTFERIGKFIDGENRIDILVIKLQKETALEHARAMQRNFVAGYLQGKYGSSSEKEAALVAFVSPDAADWRFSLVKMDYKFEQTETGKTKVKEEFTPARRWSFLVGVNENSHTAQSRLVNMLANDEHNPALAELEQAFDIETVTKEFFIKYRDLFIRTKEELDKIVTQASSLKNEFESKGVDTVNFAKKLLGQIVFLYFLQKKGWFGVGRDAEWNTGSKHFLRELFEKRHGDYKNFFNDILEPLFYEALRNDRSHDDHYYSQFNCKIPFLNGGLFDPIGNNGGYDWIKTDIHLPDSLFSNKNKTKEGDEGDGILDIFDRYNFTVREDEPLEKEVAIDPELLGKAYEKFNAIRPDNFEEYKKALKSGNKGEESKFNKQYGVYYTPREIVHYMCQQSLINYLHTELIAPNSPNPSNPDRVKDIETLIHLGEQVSENEEIALIKEQKILEGKQKSSDYKLKLPESIRKNASLIDQKLADIAVCDPAVGSGAFPVGMMSEIVKARNVLSTFIKEKNLTTYDFKHQCIEKSLYGVDIDPGAVEIAKLRLWLSLVVDEDDIKSIKPLPNLDYKIVCGNSLLGVEKNLFNNELFKKLEKIKPLYFNETNPTKKQDYKKQIDELISQITNGHKEFDFKIYFSEVFHHKKGFDVVIANPPYVRHEGIKDLKPELKKQFTDFFCGTADIYTYFYQRGLEILKSDGHLCFIAPNKFMRAGYGKKTRSLLTTKTALKIVIDFCDLPIFDATTYPSIILVEKRQPVSGDKALAATFTDVAQLKRLEDTLSDIGFSMPVSELNPEGWNLEQPEVLALMEKLKKVGTPLGEYVKGRLYRGILTGLNEAFVIDAEIRKRLIAEDLKSEEFIKPWLRGRDIKKWKAEWAGLYVINIPSSANKQWPWSNEKKEAKARKIFSNAYPAVHHHLSQWETKLKERDDQGKFWWELRSCAYYEAFEGPKIIYPNITQTNIFAFDTTGILTNQKCFIIPSADKYLLAILNSALVFYWFKFTLPLLRGAFYEPSAIFMKDLPVFHVSDKQKTFIIECVEKILAAPDSPDVSRLEAEINNLVYNLYCLTSEEIKIVEEK